jgi:hypothetical protein
MGGLWLGEELCYFYMSEVRRQALSVADAAAAEIAAVEVAAAADAEKAAAEMTVVKKTASQGSLKWTLLGLQPKLDPKLAVWETDAESHNQSIGFRFTPEQKAEAEEASILEALLRMIKPEALGKLNTKCVRTLYGQAITGSDAAFELIDRDHSGTVELEELRLALKRLGLGLKDSQLDRLHTQLDTDGNGTMSKDEFVSGLERLVAKKRKEQNRRKAEMARAAAAAPGGRLTEYVRPWSCPPSPMTMVQKLQVRLSTLMY